MNKRRWKVSALILAAMLAFTGCGGGSAGDSDGGGTKSDLIVSTSAGEPGNLHPFATNNLGMKNSAASIYECLFRLAADGSEVLPGIGESWEWSSDFMKLTVHLRKGVKFHNGEELKASDVAFSIQQWGQFSAPKASVNNSIDFDNTEVVDDYTVVINLVTPDSSVLPNLASLQCHTFIINQKAWEEMGEQFQYEPIGTGPFAFDEWVQGDHLTLKRFDDYWDGAAKLKKVMIRFIKEESQAYIELETGGIDCMMEALSTDIQRAMESEAVQVLTSEGTSVRMNALNFNCSVPELSDARVRQAIAYAIDKDAVCKTIWPVEGAAAYSILPVDGWGYDETLTGKANGYDLAKAKELMAAAGYPDGFERPLTLLTDSRDYHNSSAEIIQNALGQLGIKVNLSVMELSAQKEIMITGKGYDLYMLDYVCSATDPLFGIYRSFYPPYGITNSSQYLMNEKCAKADEFAEILDQIKTEFDETRKLALSKEMQALFEEEMYCVPLCSKEPTGVAVKNLKGIQMYGNGTLYIGNDAYFE